jgi:hypothetical protein
MALSVSISVRMSGGDKLNLPAAVAPDISGKNALIYGVVRFCQRLTEWRCDGSTR